MMPRDPLSSLRSPRIPFEKEVRLRFERFTGFIEEYCSNISPGGMFIRMESPPPAGTILGFEVRLSDDYRLIKGKGEVVWAREAGDGPERPAGVGIRFQEIDPLGKSLIYRIMEEHVKGGGIPFDPEHRPEGVTVAPRPVAVPEDLETEPVAGARALPADDEELPSPLLASVPPAEMAASPEPETGPSSAPTFSLSAEPPSWGAAPARAPVSQSVAAAAARTSRPWLLLTVAAAAAAALVVAAVFIWGPWQAQGSPEVQSADGPKVEPEETEPPGQIVEEEPEPPLPAERPAAPEPAPDVPFTRVLDISWEVVDNETVLTLTTDGEVQEERLSTVHMDDGNPRELIRLEGVVEPYRESRLVAETPQLRQVRIGHHRGRQLHVVADLASPEIRITRLERLSSSLRIHLGAL